MVVSTVLPVGVVCPGPFVTSGRAAGGADAPATVPEAMASVAAGTPVTTSAAATTKRAARAGSPGDRGPLLCSGNNLCTRLGRLEPGIVPAAKFTYGRDKLAARTSRPDGSSRKPTLR